MCSQYQGHATQHPPHSKVLQPPTSGYLHILLLEMSSEQRLWQSFAQRRLSLRGQA